MILRETDTISPMGLTSAIRLSNASLTHCIHSGLISDHVSWKRAVIGYLPKGPASRRISRFYEHNQINQPMYKSDVLFNPRADISRSTFMNNMWKTLVLRNVHMMKSDEPIWRGDWIRTGFVVNAIVNAEQKWKIQGWRQNYSSGC